MILVDSYSEDNSVGEIGVYSGSNIKIGQSFTCADGGPLNSAKFHLYKGGSPSGDCYAVLYAHSGTYGTNGIPGSLLATSDAFDVSDLPTENELVTFAFSGAEKYALQDSTYYFIVFEYSGGNSSNAAHIRYDTATLTHDGNMTYYQSEFVTFAYDAPFYVYKDSVALTVDMWQPKTNQPYLRKPEVVAY